MNKQIPAFAIVLLPLLFAATAWAGESVYIREYTYQASDLDSKVSARNNTLKLIKAGVLEEIISFVHNDSRIKQAQQDGEFKSSFIQRTSTTSAGFVKVRIIKENWTGFAMTIKAEVRADPQVIRAELERSLALQPPNPPAAASNPVTVAPAADIYRQPQAHPPPTPMLPPSMPVTPDYSGYMRAAQLSQVLSMLSPIRLRMEEYSMMQGNWPEELQDIGLDPREMNDGSLIEGVKLDQGRIIALLSHSFGKGRTLALYPESIMGGTQTRWQCETNVDLDGIANTYLRCRETDNP